MNLENIPTINLPVPLPEIEVKCPRCGKMILFRLRAYEILRNFGGLTYYKCIDGEHKPFLLIEPTKEFFDTAIRIITLTPLEQILRSSAEAEIGDGEFDFVLDKDRFLL